MEGDRRPNISDIVGGEFVALAEALRKHQLDLASEIIGEHLRRIRGPLVEQPEEIPKMKIPEVMKKHIKRSGR